ncbi:MAG: creatininase family protein [Planctomycetales bacterium]|nr:creatininase family protein [Planctomycetales bacterium]
MRPWMLAETNYAAVKQAQFEVAVLPLGATEPHNLHLPYATDTLEAQAIAERVAGAAHQQGAKVIVLPTIPYGTETNMRELPLAMNVNPSTLAALVNDLVASLVQSGVRKIVLLNSHGGNDLKPLLREMYGLHDAHVFLCNWFSAAVADRYHEIFNEREDHAGEMETSLALAYFPELVAVDSEGHLLADAGEVRPLRFAALKQGWVSMTRPWHLLTSNTGSGNPHAASAAKGERLMQLLIERLAPFLVELSASPIDADFPFA